VASSTRQITHASASLIASTTYADRTIRLWDADAAVEIARFESPGARLVGVRRADGAVLRRRHEARLG
jgi:hypothetical protein